MMLAFGVRNLRRLRDTGLLRIAPITILVGRNSSGKSTFLRSFPLLRQSTVTRTSSPILWYGDLVDFGAFDGSVYNNDIERDITFCFRVHVPTSQQNRFTARSERSYNAFEGKTVEVEYSIKYMSEGKTRISNCAINCRESTDRFSIAFDDSHPGKIRQIVHNGDDISRRFPLDGLRVTTADVFFDIYSEAVSAPPRDYLANYLQLSNVKTLLRKPLKNVDNDVLHAMAHILLSSDHLGQDVFTRSARYQYVHGNREAVSTAVKQLFDGKDFKNLYDEFEYIRKINSLVPLINLLSAMLRDTISSSLYIQPVRGSSHRFYRYQELSVSEIEPDGRNFPMFLNSLDESLREDFSQWVESVFDFGVKIRPFEGHISVVVSKSGRDINIVDTGYGISQILPVLGQIWWAQKRSTSRYRHNQKNVILTIEQPELHLHPAHQALIADAVVNLLKKQSDRAGHADLTLIIETHSESFINRIGALIGSKDIQSDSVEIIVFEASKDDEYATDVRVASFNDKGYLVNWPYGFFEAKAV